MQIEAIQTNYNTEYYNGKTGEQITEKEFNDIKWKIYNEKLRAIEQRLNQDPDSVTLDEINLLRKANKKTNQITIDYSETGYTIFNQDESLIECLNPETAYLIFRISYRITHDGNITYRNNKRMQSLKDLRRNFKYSDYIWYKKILPDIRKYNIIVESRLHNKDVIVLNPIYAMKSRTITECMFISFSDMWREKLDELDYLYLIRKFEINPEN